eukprot:4096479-Pleurochrysis_carterae.AAC.2
MTKVKPQLPVRLVSGYALAPIQKGRAKAGRWRRRLGGCRRRCLCAWKHRAATAGQPAAAAAAADLASPAAKIGAEQVSQVRLPKRFE